MKEKNNTSFVSNFALALFLCANSIAWLKLFNQMLPVVCIISFLLIVFCKCKSVFNSSFVAVLLFSIFIGFFFLLTDNYSEQTNSYLLQFAVIGVAGIIIGTQKFNWPLVAQFIIFLFPLQIATLRNIDTIALQSGSVAGFLMGISYGLLPYLLSAVYIIFSIKKRVLLRLYAIGVLIICGIFFFQYGSRGPQVGFLVFLLYLIYINIPQKFRKTFTILSLITIVGVIFSFDAIQSKLLSGDTQIYFLDKMSKLNMGDDISNGRMEIYSYTWDKICDKPLLGNGIGKLDHPDFSYPHNFLLQILLEGGFLFFIPFAILLFKATRAIFDKNIDFTIRQYIVFLLCNSLVGLMFSSYFWISQSFWIIIGIGIGIKNIKKYD